MTATPVMLTAAEVAKRLKVSKMTVYRLVEADELPFVRVGRSIRIPEVGLNRYLDGGGSSLGYSGPERRS